MQTTNRQESVTFTLFDLTENDVIGVASATGINDRNFMALNTGSVLVASVDMTKVAAPITFRMYLQAVIGGPFAGPIATYVLAPGAIRAIDSSGIGPLSGYAVKLTADPGAVAGAVIDVAARITS